MKKLIALLAMGLISASAFAAQWDMYGNVRLKGFYESRDKNLSGINESDTDLDFGLQGNSRVGAKVKVSDKMTANFELGINESNVTTRLLYSTYDFGGLKVRIGQDYTPTWFQPYNQVHNTDNGLTTYGGALYNGRVPQIKLMVAGLELALVKPSQTDTKNYDVLLPRFEAAYELNLAGLTVRPMASYQTYKMDNSSSDNSATSYLFGLGVKYAGGPLFAYANGWMGQNTKLMGYSGDSLQSPDIINKKDADDLGFAAAVGFKASDNLIFEAGYGYVQSDLEGATHKDKAQAYYANATIKIDKNFFIVPEIGVEDRMKDKSNSNQGKKTYYGAKFQANF